MIYPSFRVDHLTIKGKEDLPERLQQALQTAVLGFAPAGWRRHILNGSKRPVGGMPSRIIVEMSKAAQLILRNASVTRVEVPWSLGRRGRIGIAVTIGQVHYLYHPERPKPARVHALTCAVCAAAIGDLDPDAMCPVGARLWSRGPALHSVGAPLPSRGEALPTEEGVTRGKCVDCGGATEDYGDGPVCLDCLEDALDAKASKDAAVVELRGLLERMDELMLQQTPLAGVETQKGFEAEFHRVRKRIADLKNEIGEQETRHLEMERVIAAAKAAPLTKADVDTAITRLGARGVHIERSAAPGWGTAPKVSGWPTG